MLCQFSAWEIPLIILLCRLSVSDAVPFGQHPAGEVRPTPSSQSKSSDSVRKTTPVTEQSRSVTATPISTTNSALRSTSTEMPNSNFSNAIDANVVQAVNNIKFDEKQSPIDNSEDDSETDSSEKSNSSNGLDDLLLKPKMQKVTNNKDMSLEECMNEARRQNETYTRSIPLNVSSIDPAEDFKMAGEAEAKKMSSVNIGEDIALCWIETTTIKEDPAFDPPKRLVIREFTISFENSATIPDNYLECDRLEGEIVPGDEETVGKTSLHEVIDEDTKRSRVVNFTSVSRVGPLVVRQHRKIRCSVGAVVSKDIYEWPDGTDNPKKRVEIKVGPSVRDLGVRSSEEPIECATESLPEKPKVDVISSSSSDCTSSGSCETSASCEDGHDCNRPSTDSVCEDDQDCNRPSTDSVCEDDQDCNRPSTDSVCEDDQDCNSSSTDSVCEEDDCSSANGSTEESVPTTYPSDSNDLLPTGVTRSAVVKEPEEGVALKNASTLLANKPGRAGDEICDEDDTDCVSGNTTGWPKTDPEEMASGKNREDSTEDIGESCQEGSDDCSCSGSSCSVYSSDTSRSLETGNKRADIPATSSLMKDPNDTFTEPIETIMQLNDSQCDSGSAQCSMSESSSEGVAGTKTNPAPVRNISDNGHPTGNKEDTTSAINTDDEAMTQQAGDSELAETIDATSGSGDKDISHEELAETIDTTSGSGDKDISHEELKEGDTNSSTAESTEPSISKSEDLDTSNSPTNDSKGSCESSDDEDCLSMDSSNDESAWKSDEELKKSPNSTSSEEPEGATNSYNDADTPSLTNQTDERTASIETESTRSSSLPGEQSTDCSASSESGDCGAITTSSTLRENKTILPSNQDDTALSLESCDSSDSCGSTELGLDSMETDKVSINSTASVETPEGSTCDESSESCESPSSSTDSETCEDGSSNGDCTSDSDSQVSESCDSSSGSCSSESSDPTSVAVETESTTTEATSTELENSSTTIDNISTTLETRRSTVPTLSLTSSPSGGRHRLALRIRVLLERVNENKEKEKLVQVEKNLLINENPNEHGNQSLLWKVKSLNDTMNIETLKAIFNCSSFGKLSEGLSNLTEFGQDKERGGSMDEKSVDPPLEESMVGSIEENNDNSTDESTESLLRKKRETPILEQRMMNHTNITDATKAKAIREGITGIEEDLKKGMDHVLFRVSKELDSQASSGVGKGAESSSSSILKILASPIDGRVHSRRRRGVKKVGAVMFVEQLKNPVKGEEIDRWSNERIVRADGGNVRSVMEFKLLRDAVEASTKVPPGS